MFFVNFRFMKAPYFLVLALLLFLCSCGSMRITTSIVKKYPSLQEDEPIEVYFNTSEVPIESEALGIVRAFDSGTSNKCDSLTAVEHLKTEARKVGGNAVKVTKYIKPSHWGSSCHQMEGAILRIHDFNSASSEIEEHITSDTIKPERILPPWRFGLNAGYSWRGARIPMEITGEARDLVETLKKAPAFQGDLQYYVKDSWGIGLTYSAFTASSGRKFDTKAKGSTLIQYAGVDWILRGGKGKWVSFSSLGVGYVGYNFRMDNMWNYYKEWGSTIGCRALLGVDYLLNPSWSIGLNIDVISGLVYNINVDDNGSQYKIKAESKDTAVGLGQYRITAGIRHYF